MAKFFRLKISGLAKKMPSRPIILRKKLGFYSLMIKLFIRTFAYPIWLEQKKRRDTQSFRFKPTRVRIMTWRCYYLYCLFGSGIPISST